MKSHGILSRYMRPGFKEGEEVEMHGDITRDEYENLGLLAKLKHNWKTVKKESDDKIADIEKSQIDYKKQRNDFFRIPGNYAIYSRERFSDNPTSWLGDDTTKSKLTQIYKEDFNPEKVRDGTQVIFELDNEGYLKLDGSSIFGSYAMKDLPFLFYNNSNDADMFWDDNDRWLTNTGKMLWGKDFADDTTSAEKWSERRQMLRRAIAGGIITLPELAMGTYRFLQPFDAFGGVGPWDTFYPKNEAQKELTTGSNFNEVPYYSDFVDWLSGDEDRPAGTTPDNWFKHKPSLYKDDLYDDESALNLQYIADSRKDYKEKYSDLSDDQIINSMMDEYDVTLEEAQSYLDEEIKPFLNMTDKEFSSQAYMADRNNLMHVMPGALGGSLPGLAIPVVGPVGIAGNVVGKLAPLSIAAKKLNQLNKIKKFKVLDKSSGLGLPQGGTEAINQQVFIDDEGTDFDTQDSIYPE